MNRQDYHDLETLLSEVRPQADQKFYFTLRQKVLNAFTTKRMPPQGQGRFSLFPRLRLWQPAAAVVMVLLLILVLTPGGRTLAQQVWRLGVFFVTDNPSLAEQWINDPPSEDEIYSLNTEPGKLEEASELAGFTVYYPTYLPPGYKPDSDSPIQLVSNTQGEITSTEAMFNSADGGYVLYYVQHPFPPDSELSAMPLDVGDADVESVLVQGNEALWLTNYVWGTERDETGNIQPVEYNVLIWTLPASDGAKYYFWLGSEEKLSKAEMMHIAESMTAQ
ncbi:MAG: hypothetical protein P8183_10125 [Anaerolineae bacterium]